MEKDTNVSAESSEKGKSREHDVDGVEKPNKEETSANVASSTESKQIAAPAEPETITYTGIGRPYNKDGKTLIIDEAEWEGLPQQLMVSDQFVLTISGRDQKRESLTIWSKYVQHVFKTQIPFSPDIALDAKSISFSEPYAPLYFHFDDLDKYVRQDNNDDNIPFKDDFESLRTFYNKWVKPTHDQVRSSLHESNVRYLHLWAVFQPGELLYAKDEFDEPTLYITGACAFRGAGQDSEDIVNVTQILQSMVLANKPRGRLAIDVWGLKWDGSTRVFSRSIRTLTINEYVGTRNVQSFPFYPLKFYADGDKAAQDQLFKELEDRGYIWKAYVSDRPCCRVHEGPARELAQGFSTAKPSEQRTSLHERVIVDHNGASQMLPELKFSPVGTGMDIIDPLIQMFNSFKAEPQVQQGAISDKYVEFDGIPPSQAFTPLQAALCPSLVNCISLESKVWYQVTVKNLQEVQWSKQAFDHLVLDPGFKEMLRGLVESHRKNRGRVISDVIQGKGKGLVMVLHGPPGVGKTLTAESVAEYTQKPLFPINVGELTMETSVVPRLQDVFDKASRWDAVLLLDEADVVLEQRSFEDLKRNGIVSVFLRMLEYYEGILFLTTNRLGTMDSAFQSRIHLAVRYKPLNPASRRQIWRNFIDRLDKSEQTAKAELLENLADLEQWDVNGRQIRNILTVAQSLALNKTRMKGSLRYDHVEMVASETLKFQDFFGEALAESRKKLGEVPKQTIVGRSWPTQR